MGRDMEIVLWLSAVCLGLAIVMIILLGGLLFKVIREGEAKDIERRKLRQ
jgi:hypothetical protein